MSALVMAEYKGLKVQFNKDGWFNATAAAKKFGKLPNEWLRLPATDDYLKGLERKYGSIPHLKTKRGASGGTWFHPKLAVSFARWLDIDFAIWCDEKIDQILRGNPSDPIAAAMALTNSLWEQRMEIEKKESSSKALASWGGRAMRKRRDEAPIYKLALSKLSNEIQLMLPHFEMAAK